MLDNNSLHKIKNHAQGYVWHWIYQEHGRATMVVTRYETKGIKTYRQFVYQGGEWIEGMTPTPYPLYGLDSLALVSPFKSVIFCEGEKCANLLHQLHYNALTTALGAKSVAHTDFSPIRHFQQFVILQDNDKAGAAYARDVAIAIRKIRPDAAIQVYNLMSEAPGGDLIDWVQSTPLCGNSWDGYSQLSQEHLTRVSEALHFAIQKHSLPIEECKTIGFKSELTLFDGDPKPIENRLCPVPAFPSHLFPQKITDYLSLSARQLSIPVDFPATSFLALIGGIIGREIKLEMRPGQRWEEVANVWAVLVGPPSSKKSPTLRRMCRPLTTLESRAAKEYADAIAKLKQPPQNKQDSADEVAPSLRRYITDDCSIPKLRELLSKNPRGMILRSDELKGQFQKLEQDGHEGDRSFMMQCWAGLDVYNEDRVIRGSCLQIPLTVTWIGAIQPPCLAHYLRQALSGGNGADGFMQRFQMVTFPDFEKTYQVCKEQISEDLERTIEELFTSIDENTRSHGRILRFSEEAQEHFDNCHTALENDCRSGDHQPHWESHMGKLPKLIASLCIILHIIDEVLQNTSSDVITLATLKNAEAIAAYYQAHALRCYECIESAEFSDAQKILDLVRKKKLPSRFKAADIYHNNLGGMRDRMRVINALSLLQDFGYVAQEKVYGPTKPAEFWIVHPKVLEKA